MVPSFLKQEQRAARPKSPIGQIAPGRRIGIPGGVAPAGNQLGSISVTKTHISSPKHMSNGGPLHFDDGGNVDLGYNDSSAWMPDTPALSPTADYQTPDASGAVSNMALPASQPYNIDNGSDSGGGPSSYGSYQGHSDPDGQSGFAGWLNSKHAGGIDGKTYLKAGLTALTGILSGIANKRAAKVPFGPAPAVTNTNVGNIGVGMATGGPVTPNIHMQSPMEPEVWMSGGGNVHMDSPMEPRVWMDEGGQMPPMDQPQAPMQAQQQAGAQGADPKQALVASTIQALLGQSQNPQQVIQQFIQVFGQQAFQMLQQKVSQAGQQGGIGAQQAPGMATGGGMLHGGGDGMSDSMMANGGGVRVSNGEYILDADTVSAIGNGSSEAGAKKLDAARAQLRQRKYGKTSQPPQMSDSSNPLLRGMMK